MTAVTHCRQCHQPILWWDAPALKVPELLNRLIRQHQCGNGPMRCDQCGRVIAATLHLEPHLARAAQAVHRRYCPQRKKTR